MKKWFQGVVVKHKEIDNKMYHCFDDENFEKLTNERNEQLKEIERLNNIINELFEYLKENSKQPELFESDRYYENVLDKLQELLGSDKE